MGGSWKDEIGFAGRLAYLRWLLDRGRTDRLTDAELADWLGVGVKWLGKWKEKAASPNGLAEADAIERALARKGWARAWLYGGTGSPPEPAQWEAWLADYRAHRAESPADVLNRLQPAERRPASELIAKTAKKGGKGKRAS